jgi:hypothetical protein
MTSLSLHLPSPPPQPVINAWDTLAVMAYTVVWGTLGIFMIVSSFDVGARAFLFLVERCRVPTSVAYPPSLVLTNVST